MIGEISASRAGLRLSLFSEAHMSDALKDIADRHLRICARFGNEVSTVGDQWQSQSPCIDWDARGVLEHVIGFHDVLLLRPLGEKPQRPKGDPVGRWTTTLEALDRLLNRPGLFGSVVDVSQVGNNPPSHCPWPRGSTHWWPPEVPTPRSGCSGFGQRRSIPLLTRFLHAE